MAADGTTNKATDGATVETTGRATGHLTAGIANGGPQPFPFSSSSPPALTRALWRLQGQVRGAESFGRGGRTIEVPPCRRHPHAGLGSGVAVGQRPRSVLSWHPWCLQPACSPEWVVLGADSPDPPEASPDSPHPGLALPAAAPELSRILCRLQTSLREEPVWGVGCGWDKYGK